MEIAAAQHHRAVRGLQGRLQLAGQPFQRGHAAAEAHRVLPVAQRQHALVRGAGAFDVPGRVVPVGVARNGSWVLVADDPAPWQTLVLYGICVASFVTPPVLAVTVAL